MMAGAPDHAEELKVSLHQRLLLVRDGSAAPDIAVGVQQRRGIDAPVARPFGEHVAHELEIVVAIALGTKESALRDLGYGFPRPGRPLGVAPTCRWALLGERLAEALRQVGVAACP